MTVSAKIIAGYLAEHMRRNALDVLTMRWAAFYELCERDRMKAGFIVALAKQLQAESIMFVRGQSVVALVKDFDFSPLRTKD